MTAVHTTKTFARGELLRRIPGFETVTRPPVDAPPVCAHAGITQTHLDECCADGVDCDRCGKPVDGLTGLQLPLGEIALCTDCTTDDNTFLED